MISKSILDKLLPIPTHEELLQRAQQEFGSKEFPLTNTRKGSVWYSLLMILFQIRIELAKLSQSIVNNCFVAHAQEGWLELSASDYSKFRKEAQKAQGVVTLARSKTDGVLRIKKGHVFKTAMDGSGQEYRYLVTAETVMGTGQGSCTVPIEAERPGIQYNVPDNTIVKSIIHLETVDAISNQADWLMREGSDLEELETFRERTQNAWSELATQPTRDKYKSICEAIPGVLAAQIVDDHPRGQGTMDIIITSVSGEATEALLAEVKAAALAISSPDDDILVRSADTVTQAVTLTLTVDQYANTDGLAEQSEYILRQMMMITNRSRLNELLISDIIFQQRKELPAVTNVLVAIPAADVKLERSKVVVLGAVSITIERI